MASEFFAEAGNAVAITLTPGDGGVLTVIVDGEKIFDKADEGHPNLVRLGAELLETRVAKCQKQN